MKNILLVLFLFSGVLFSQQPLEKISPVLNSILNQTKDNEEILVWVFFIDKGNNLQKYYSAPENILSEKSLKRRLKTGNPDVQENDLPVNQVYIDQVTSSGLKLKNKTRWFNGISGYIKKSEMVKILSFSFVRKIDAVKKFRKDDKERTENYNTSNRQIQYKLSEFILDYGESFTQVQQINVPALHNLGYTGQNVTVCVMDAGFNRLSHEAFSSMNIIATWDFVNGDPDVGNGGMGDGSHGTQTLSTIGGYKSGKLIGPAFGSDYILAKTENTDSETPIEEDNWVAALEWADSIGVDVTSTSLSYLDYDPPYASYTWQDMDGNTALITIAGDLAVQKGISVFNSAGNNGYNSSHNTLGAPADGDSIMAIGAVYASGERVGFSSVGNTVDGRIKPDVMAMGSGVVVASPYSNTQYQYSDGTSFSCPLAAGVAALLLSYNPNLTPIQIRDAMRNTASNHESPNREYGWGIVNALSASEYFPVPVELISFTGKYNDGKIVLEWQTASELNNAGFEVQVLNKNEWITEAFIKGKGTSTNINSYSIVLLPHNEGTNFYRIKQVDFDGKVSFSDQIEVEATLVTEYRLFQNYPNPFNPATIIKFSVPEEVFTRMELFDVIGNKISDLFNGVVKPGNHEITLNSADFNLSSGFYVVNLRSGKYVKSIKIMLMK